MKYLHVHVHVHVVVIYFLLHTVHVATRKFVQKNILIVV